MWHYVGSQMAKTYPAHDAATFVHVSTDAEIRELSKLLIEQKQRKMVKITTLITQIDFHS